MRALLATAVGLFGIVGVLALPGNAQANALVNDPNLDQVTSAVDDFNEATLAVDGQTLDIYGPAGAGAAQEALSQIEPIKQELESRVETSFAPSVTKDMISALNRLQTGFQDVIDANTIQDVEAMNIALADLQSATDEYNTQLDRYTTAGAGINTRDLIRFSTSLMVYVLVGSTAFLIGLGATIWLYVKRNDTNKALRRLRWGITLTAYVLSLTSLFCMFADVANENISFSYWPVLAALIALLIYCMARYASIVQAAKPKPTVKDNAKLAVSPAFFVVVSIATSGIYAFYWTWKAWRTLRTTRTKKYNASLLALTAIASNFWLFRFIQQDATKAGYRSGVDFRWLAAIVLALELPMFGALFQAQNPWWSLYTFIGLAVMCLVMVPVVKAYNRTVGGAKKQLLPLGSPWVIFTIIALTCLGAAVIGIASQWDYLMSEIDRSLYQSTIQ
jgi:hypothetical protein